MPRVELELPPRLPFAVDVPVRIADVNYGGHVGNDAFLSLVQEARIAFFRAHGWTELDVDGVGIIVADAALVYVAEARHGMTLRIELGAADVRPRGCDLLYRVSDAATGREVARVKTGILFFDYAARKVARMPARFRALVEGPAAAAGAPPAE